MQLAGSTHKLQLARSSDADIDVVVSYVDASNAVPPVVQGDTMGTTPTSFNSAATGDILAAPSGSELRKVKEISIANKDTVTSCDVTLVLDVSATDYRIAGPFTLRPGESVHFIDGQGWIPIYLQTNPALRTIVLSADQSNSTSTPTEVTGMSLTTGIGTFAFTYYCLYQSTATGTGVKFSVNHTGTVTRFVANRQIVGAATLASDAAADQDVVTAAGGLISVMAARAKSTTGWGTSISVDTANADMLEVIEGLMVVTADGDIELWHGSEGAVQTTCKAGSSLVLIRTGD